MKKFLNDFPIIFSEGYDEKIPCGGGKIQFFFSPLIYPSMWQFVYLCKILTHQSKEQYHKWPSINDPNYREKVTKIHVSSKNNDH